jgi:Spy/CpxP family protein refolding chaperone
MKAARVAALGAAIVFGVSVTATAQPPARSAERVATTDSVRHRGGPGRGEGRQFHRALFKGVTLTDAQKQQLKQIQQKYAGERHALVAQLRPAGTAAGQRVRPDSAQRVALRTQSRALMEKQMSEIRGILTADQQKAFDANVAAFRDRAKAHEGKRAARRSA